MEGYEVTIHRSLTEKMLIAGVPREIAILNGAFMTMSILFWHTFYVLPLNFVLHFAAAIATKKDPQFLDCYIRYVKRKNYYST